MKRTRPVLCLIGLFVIAGLGAWHLVINDTYVRQQIRMEKARKHAALIAPLLQADATFSKVTVRKYTAAGGSMVIAGYIEDEKAFDRLRSLVILTNPPVTVFFQLISHSKTETFYEVIPHAEY